MNTPPKSSYSSIAWVLIYICVLITVVVLFLFLKNRNYSIDLPIANDVFGQFGDVIGGVIGSLISLVSVLLLFETLSQQRIQFRDQQVDSSGALESQRLQYIHQQKNNDLFFKREQIESRFFALLNFHRGNADTIRVGDKIGRSVFISLERELSCIFRSVDMICKKRNESMILRDKINITYLCFYYGAVNEKTEKTIRFALVQYDQSLIVDILFQLRNTQQILMIEEDFAYDLFVGHQSRLGHYFRNLYQTIKYINQIENSILDYRSKYSYISTLRAQFTTHEQVIILYNSLSDLGRSWESGQDDENLKLITKYNLIRNIPYGFIPFLDPDEFYPYVAYEGEKEPIKRKSLKENYI